MAENMRDGKFAHGSTAAPAEHRVMPLFSLAGRTAIVSGAGAGIGLAVAQALAEAGANVAIWYNSNREALARAAEIEKTYGVRCAAYQVDVTSCEAVEAAVDRIVAGLGGGRLDVFVANSGVAWEQGPMLDGALDHYRRVTSTNFDGTFYCARAAGKHFRRQKREGTTLQGEKLEDFNQGSFIATASMSGHIANIPQLQAAYNASKAAVTHLCKCSATLGAKWPGGKRRTDRGDRQIAGRRVGGLREGKFREPRVYQHGDLQVQLARGEERVGGQDPYGVSRGPFFPAHILTPLDVTDYWTKTAAKERRRSSRACICTLLRTRRRIPRAQTLLLMEVILHHKPHEFAPALTKCWSGPERQRTGRSHQRDRKWIVLCSTMLRLTPRVIC